MTRVFFERNEYQIVAAHRANGVPLHIRYVKGSYWLYCGYAPRIGVYDKHEELLRAIDLAAKVWEIARRDVPARAAA